MNDRTPGKAVCRAETADEIQALREEAAAENFFPMMYLLDEFLKRLRRQVDLVGMTLRRVNVMSKPSTLPEIDLDVADVRLIALIENPQGETVISLEMSSKRVMNLIFSPTALTKLEALLAKANEAQAQASPIQ